MMPKSDAFNKPLNFMMKSLTDSANEGNAVQGD